MASELNGCEQKRMEFSMENTYAHQRASRARGIYSQVCQFSPLWAYMVPLLVLHSYSHTIGRSLFLCSFYPLNIFAEGCPYSLLWGNFSGVLIYPHRDQIIDCCVSPSQDLARAILDCGCNLPGMGSKKNSVSYFLPWYYREFTLREFMKMSIGQIRVSWTFTVIIY